MQPLCYEVLNEDYILHKSYKKRMEWCPEKAVTIPTQALGIVARNPPTCPTEKRSLGENLVNDGRMWCSAQVRIDKWTQFHCVKFRLESAGEPTICSHCYSVPYMKIPVNNQVMFMFSLKNLARKGLIST